MFSFEVENYNKIKACDGKNIQLSIIFAKWMEIHVKGAKKSQLMLQDTFTICKKKSQWDL